MFAEMALRMRNFLGQTVPQLVFEPVPVRLRAYVGNVVALDSRHGVLLETHLPPRYYLPPGEVDLSRLTPSTCAYKGHASYLSTTDGQAAGRDIAWTYLEPLDDALRVRDRIAFWNERTDIRVDGELQPRPVTPWSTPAEQAATDVERLEFG